MKAEPENMRIDTAANWKYCREILPKVSRTFALNITQLEGDIHRAVLLGYLFFRIADTFEDNTFQNEAEKIAALEDYAGIFTHNKSLDDRLRLYESLKYRWEEDSPDKNLIENGDRVIRCCFGLPAAYREIIDRHIARAAAGMASFQKRNRESHAAVFQLRDIAELEEYCYYVAGVVGEMLTQMFCQREALSAVKPELEKHQTRFGLALQVTNIVKDYQKDISRGWCYIPASITQKYGITPDHIVNLTTLQKQSILQELMPALLGYFDSTLEYIKLIPVQERPIHMFCIIPFVLAYNTMLHISQLRGIKLSRDQVATLLTQSESFAGSNDRLERDYHQARQKLSSYCLS